MHAKFLILIFAFFATVFAEGSPFGRDIRDTAAFDTIAGDLPPVLVAKTRPFYVAGDIYVPQGKTVTISAGTIFCFKNFTSLHVMGTLLAKGAKDRPIVFTSENDKDYNKKSAVDPAPYDWNGIYIHEDGIGTQLSYCAVMYSVDGISALTKFFRLSPCVFLHNGRANLATLGAPQPVTDKPYEYSLSGNDASAGGALPAALADPFASSRKVIRVSGGASLAIGVIAIAAYAVHLGSTQKAFSAISRTDRTNLAANSSRAWTDARTGRDRDVAGMIAGIGVAATGAVGVLWSFRF